MEVEEEPSPASHDPQSGVFLCWGSGEFGQHGHGESRGYMTCQHSALPQFGQTEANTVKFMACGASHTVVVTNSNEIYGWGNCNSGQLGVGDRDTRWQPVVIQLYALQPRNPVIKGVACGGRHTFVWLENGHMFSFGNNFFAQLGYDFRIKNYKENQVKPHLLRTLSYRVVTQVACGEKHSLFLFHEGVVAAVGSNSYGQIGCSNRTEAVVPKFLEDMHYRITAIACGANHNLIIDEWEDVYIWGYGKACGTNTVDLLLPQKVAFKRRNIVSVAGGQAHSMALSANGNVYTWGDGSGGQLGQGSHVHYLSQPQQVRDRQMAGQVVQIACGELYSSALTEEGSLYMWGRNSHVISPAQEANWRSPQPCRVDTGGHSLTRVSCGAWHAAAITGTPDWQKRDDESDGEWEEAKECTEGQVAGNTGHSNHTKMTESVSSGEDDGSEAEESEEDIALYSREYTMHREKTSMTLAEFYAPSPEAPSRIAGSPDMMEWMGQSMSMMPDVEGGYSTRASPTDQWTEAKPVERVEPEMDCCPATPEELPMPKDVALPDGAFQNLVVANHPSRISLQTKDAGPLSSTQVLFKKSPRNTASMEDRVLMTKKINFLPIKSTVPGRQAARPQVTPGLKRWPPAIGHPSPGRTPGVPRPTRPGRGQQANQHRPLDPVRHGGADPWVWQDNKQIERALMMPRTVSFIAKGQARPNAGRPVSIPTRPYIQQQTGLALHADIPSHKPVYSSGASWKSEQDKVMLTDKGLQLWPDGDGPHSAPSSATPTKTLHVTRAAPASLHRSRTIVGVTGRPTRSTVTQHNKRRQPASRKPPHVA